MQARLSSNPFLILGKRQSLGWRNHVGFIFPAFISAALFDSQRNSGEVLAWLGVAGVGAIVTIVSIETLSVILRKSHWQTLHPFLTTIILLGSGFLRGLSIFLLAGNLGLIDDSELLFRLVGGPIFVFTSYLMFNWVVDEYLEYVKQLAALRAERESLENGSLEFEAQIVSLQEMQKANIREMLTPAIWELQKQLSGAKSKRDISDAIFELRSINERIVRPLSHELSTASTDDQVSASAPGEITRQSYKWPKEVMFSKAIESQFFVFASIAISFSAIVSTFGPLRGFFALAIASVVSYLVVALSARFGRRLVSPGLGLVFSALLGAANGAIVAVVIASLQLTPLSPFLAQAAVFYSITLALTFFLGVLRLQRELSLQESEQMVEQRKLLNSRLRQRVWLGRKALAMELHGSIQGALQSVAMRLSRLDSPSAADLNLAVEEVNRAMENLEREDHLAGKQLETLLQELKLLWDGALEIELDLDRSALEKLDKDSSVSRCVLEAAREAITNSAKHGKAQNAKISLRTVDQLALLTIENDGTMPTGSKAGKGFELYETISYRHHFEKNGNKVRLVLEIPLSPSGEALPLV